MIGVFVCFLCCVRSIWKTSQAPQRKGKGETRKCHFRQGNACTSMRGLIVSPLNRFVRLIFYLLIGCMLSQTLAFLQYGLIAKPLEWHNTKSLSGKPDGYLIASFLAEWPWSFAVRYSFKVMWSLSEVIDCLWRLSPSREERISSQFTRPSHYLSVADTPMRMLRERIARSIAGVHLLTCYLVPVAYL